ncbi:MAG: hypothetical protein KC912_14260 [Proteobacteria bacterium]|nr:hypothetical protein [Pseudomonadota bacterium]
MIRTATLFGLMFSASAMAEPTSFVLGLHAGPTFALTPLNITALPRLTLGVELPPAQRRIRLWAGAAWAPPQESGSADDARVGSGSFDYTLKQQELLVGGGIAIAITRPDAPVVFDLELGPQVFLLESRVNGSADGQEFGEHREVYARIGVLGALGLRIQAGPGEVAVQAMMTASALNGRITGPTHSAAITPLVGYRLVL